MYAIVEFIYLLRFSLHISFCILWCGRQTKSSVGIRLKPILGVGAVKALR